MLGYLQTHIANEAAISPAGGFQPFGDGFKIGSEPFDRRTGLVAQGPVHDGLRALVVAIEDRNAEGVL